MNRVLEKKEFLRILAISRQGFTLLEVMLATIILAMVVSMVTISLSGSLRVVEATREQGALYYRAQVTFQRMSEDFSSAVLPEGLDFIASGGAGDNAGSPRVLVRFVSMAHLVFDASNGQEGMGAIGYALAEDPDSAGQFLLLRSDSLLRPQEKKGSASDSQDGFVLCDRLRSVTLSYFDSEGERVESWDTQVDDNVGAAEKKRLRRLPEAVSCRLEFWLDREEETTLSFETKFEIPVGRIVDRDAEDNAS